MSRGRDHRDELRTSYRVQGDTAVDNFRALCVLLGRRPHQLVAELVDEGIARLHAEDPELAGDVANLAAVARNHQREREIRELDATWASEPVPGPARSPAIQTHQPAQRVDRNEGEQS